MFGKQPVLFRYARNVREFCDHHRSVWCAGQSLKGLGAHGKVFKKHASAERP